MHFKRLLQLFSAVILLLACNSTPVYDIVISNGTIYDGRGNEPLIADIGIKDDVIVTIGDLSEAETSKKIDASGLVVSPGFIDLHAHLEPIMQLSECESHVRQGVTTSLGGPDGSSPWPFGKYLDSLSNIGVGMNVAYLIGHNTVRMNVMKLDNRAPTNDEMIKMKNQISLAMDEGAFGISTGLKYVPGSFSNVEEVIALSKEASAKGGIYTSHLRDEGIGIIEGVNEAITISEKASIPVVLTHHKIIGKPMWGKSDLTLALVDSARTKGLDIKMDQYPYSASHTGISVLIPSWARAGGNTAFIERVSNPVLRDSIKAGIVFNILNDRGGDDLDRIQFARVNWMPELEGKTLKYWCNLKGLEPTVENGADLAIEAQVNGGASCIFHAMYESDVENIMKHPLTMIASDGRLVVPGDGRPPPREFGKVARPSGGHPHPRAYGTFPRVLGYYVRKKQTIPLSQAIYKMTYLPAQTLGLNDRGLLKEGLKADITIFDPNTIIDKATFEEPHQYSEGIYYVLVNGQLAIDNQEFQNIKAGKVLKRGQ